MKIEYRVIWEIDVDAESPKEAIKEAVAILQPIDPAKWVWGVKNNKDHLIIEGKDVFDQPIENTKRSALYFLIFIVAMAVSLGVFWMIFLS